MCSALYNISEENCESNFVPPCRKCAFVHKDWKPEGQKYSKSVFFSCVSRFEDSSAKSLPKDTLLKQTV